MPTADDTKIETKDIFACLRISLLVSIREDFLLLMVREEGFTIHAPISRFEKMAKNPKKICGNEGPYSTL